MTDQRRGVWTFMGREVPPPTFVTERTADGWLTRVTYWLPKLAPDPTQKRGNK